MKTYQCDICDYNTVRKYNYEKHLKSDIHSKSFQSIHAKEKNIYKCLSCEYIFQRKSNYNRHVLKCSLNDGITIEDKNNGIVSATFIQNTNILGAKKEQLDNESKNKYICEICEFSSTKRLNYEKHLSSNKHTKYMKLLDTLKNTDVNVPTTDLESFKNTVISTLMEQMNSVLEENNKMILAEQTKHMMEITSTNITNNNTNNQSFNLNMFLNETCKDAMNIGDFIAGMDVTIEDMELTGTMGFAKAMNHIIMKNLNAIDVCKRPIHCSDVKRETMYYKHNGVWERDTDDKKKTKELIYNLSFVNWKRLMDWRFLPRNKGYDLSDHYKNDEFTKLVMEVNTVDMNEINKVITYLCRDVAIDKAKFRAGGYRKKNL